MPSPVGTWLSLVERTLGVGEVASSNLVVPTISSRNSGWSHGSSKDPCDQSACFGGPLEDHHNAHLCLRHLCRSRVDADGRRSTVQSERNLTAQTLRRAESLDRLVRHAPWPRSTGQLFVPADWALDCSKRQFASRVYPPGEAGQFKALILSTEAGRVFRPAQWRNLLLVLLRNFGTAGFSTPLRSGRKDNSSISPASPNPGGGYHLAQNDRLLQVAAKRWLGRMPRPMPANNASHPCCSPRLRFEALPDQYTAGSLLYGRLNLSRWGTARNGVARKVPASTAPSPRTATVCVHCARAASPSPSIHRCAS